MANVHTWATTPEPITLADGAFTITPLVSSRGALATFYTLQISDRDGGTLGYIHSYHVWHDGDPERRPDADTIARDLRDWAEAWSIIPAGVQRTLTAMRRSNASAYQSILNH